MHVCTSGGEGTKQDTVIPGKRIISNLVGKISSFAFFVLYFRAEGKIKHCKIFREGRLYTIGTAQFESLVELVEFYEKHPLYRKMKLKHPINEEVSASNYVDLVTRYSVRV